MRRAALLLSIGLAGFKLSVFPQTVRIQPPNNVPQTVYAVGVPLINPYLHEDLNRYSLLVFILLRFRQEGVVGKKACL